MTSERWRQLEGAKLFKGVLMLGYCWLHINTSLKYQDASASSQLGYCIKQECGSVILAPSQCRIYSDCE